MKLDEIIIASSKFPEYDDVVMELSKHSFQNSAVVKKLPHQLTIRRRKVKDLISYGLMKADELVGWITLRPIELHGRALHVLELIYVLPKFRKTTAAAHLVLHLKELAGTPLIVGDEQAEGGVLFPGGAELIDALRARPDAFTLSLLNLKTGETRPLPKTLETNYDYTILIESRLPLPHLRESLTPPGGWGTSSFDEWMDWFGDVT